MAKTPIGLGQFSGRVGGIVYAVQAGRQVVRAYQPVVSNPKSTAQSVQRAKGNLVGRISKITPWQILEGLGDNKFNRRSRFLKLLLRNVTAGQAAGEPSKFVAKLADADFVFSEGALVPLHTISDPTYDDYTVSMTASRVTGVSDLQAASQGLLVVCVVCQASGGWEEVQYRFLSPDDFKAGAISVPFRHRVQGAYNAKIYSAAFGTADGSKLPTVSGDLTSSVNSLDAILAVGTGSSSVVWSNSEFCFSGAFTPSTTASVSGKSMKSK